MANDFNITPEQQASLPRFLAQQIRTKPLEVTGVDLAGQTAIVTGANTGVGFATSLQLLNLGLSRLILAVRNQPKGNTARETLIERTTQKAGAYTVEVWPLDLSEYDSITAFVERARTLDRLDYVNLNAGIAPAEQIFNEHTGHDEMIQVNYLSTALLAILLLPVIKEKLDKKSQPSPSRVTLTNSEISAWTKFEESAQVPLLAHFDKKLPHNSSHVTAMMDRLAVSKLLGQFFMSELVKRVPPSVAIINAASPGTCTDAELNKDHDKKLIGKLVKVFRLLTGNPCSVGARMITDALVKHGPESHGQFLSFQNIVP